jgi:MFS family permease
MANDLAEPATGFRVRPGLALLVLGGSIALDVSALALLNAALPLIGEDFGISTAMLQWTMTSYAVTFAGFLLLGGRAADVLGRRRMFAIGVGLFVAAAFAGAFAPGIVVLIIARAVQGIGAALTGPAALALLTEVFPAGPGRDRAFAVFGSIGAASFSGGLIFGGVLTDLLSWRAVFLLSGLFGLVVLAATRAALPPSVRHPHSLDLAGAALVTGGMVLAVFGIGRGPENGWSDPVTIGSLVVAAVLLAGFLVRERRPSRCCSCRSSGCPPSRPRPSPLSCTTPRSSRYCSSRRCTCRTCWATRR